MLPSKRVVTRVMFASIILIFILIGWHMSGDEDDLLMSDHRLADGKQGANFDSVVDRPPNVNLDIKIKPKLPEYEKNNALLQSCVDKQELHSEAKLNIQPMKFTPQEEEEIRDINCTTVRISSEGIAFPLCLYRRVEDLSISGDLVKSKHVFEKQNLISIAKWLKQLKDALFIDIGANIGLYTLMAASLDMRVLAVEPRRENVLRIRKALQSHGYQERVVILQNAISDVRSTMRLLTHRFEQGRTIVVCNQFCENSETEVCWDDGIDTVIMDDLLRVMMPRNGDVYSQHHHSWASPNFTKAIMKIDIEGHEIKAFAHSEQFFQQIRVPMIHMEWDWRQRFQSRDPEDRETVRRFINMLMGHRYRPEDDKGNVLQPRLWDSWPVDVHWVLYNALGDDVT